MPDSHAIDADGRQPVALLAVIALAMAPAHAQLPRAPSGGPTGAFLGPPSGNQADFLGVWNLRWVGPMGSNCPCSGSLIIKTNKTVVAKKRSRRRLTKRR